MIRSTTDEMLAARHDPEPYVRTYNGVDPKRITAQHASYTPSRYENGFGEIVVTHFAPRVECIPSRDPEPVRYVRGFSRQGGGIGLDMLHRFPHLYVFDPRPEYTRPEPNPILVAFREPKAATIWHFIASLDEPAVWWPNATPADIEDARKVLTRLVEVFG